MEKLPEIIIYFSIAFALAVIAGVVFIPILKKLKIGQYIKEDGPKDHQKKAGIPTIGGIIFIIPIIIIAIFLTAKTEAVIPFLIIVVGFGLVGFADDFQKLFKKSNDGLSPIQKTGGLILVSIIFTLYLILVQNIETVILIPFTSIELLLPPCLYIPFTILVLYAGSNAVNLTDGIDGLATSVTIVVMIFFTIISVMNPEWLLIKDLSAIVAGACLGFLVFNKYPAKVFMGDTGSLALGGAVLAITVTVGLHLILLIAGIIYVIETLSVMIQVAYFKRTKKRFFKMAPIHHHFEIVGWKEKKIVRIFTTITVVASIISILSLSGFMEGG